MQPVLNLQDIKQVEHALTDVGVSISELMYRAGASCANEAAALEGVSEVLIFCGLGNNGGDGWVAASQLVKKNLSVKLISAVDPDDINSDVARVVAQRAAQAGVEIYVAPPRSEIQELLASADLVIDAILGTGFHGELRAPFDIWIDCINSSGAEVLSVDVPSGLNAQTGLASGAYVIANMTVTMLALKPGLLSDIGRDACGAIIVAPLAEQTERLVLEADPVAWRLDLEDYSPVLIPPSNAVDKFSRGTVLVVAGSSRYPGAAVLAARSAARAGAGYVTLACPSSIATLIQMQLPEIPVIGLPEQDGCFATEAAPLVLKLAEKRDACLIGPGIRTTTGTSAVVSTLLGSNVPLVVDADGLNCIARLTSNKVDDFPELLRREAPLFLTPHRRELGRLVGQPENPPASLTAMLDAARRIVWSDGGSELVVVAKGSATACISADVAVLPKPGPAALATAGSGDVLAGCLASLLAQAKQQISNDDLCLLAALAAEIHGYAGSIASERFGSRAVMAQDLPELIGLAHDALDEQVSEAGLMEL